MYTWSVAIPTYNSARYLEETLQSVLSQDLGADRMEIIVVDNRSTDNTLDIVERVSKGRVRIVINEYNVGPHGNFNRCIDVSSGELLHVLHSDDLVKPEFYEKFESVFKTYPDVHLVCCRADFINNKSVVVGGTNDVNVYDSPSNDVSNIMYQTTIVTPSVVVRRGAYAILGGFDTSFSFVGDWDMWARIIHKLKGVYIKDILAQYRFHSDNGTTQLESTEAALLDHEKLYNKFLKSDFPITRDKADLAVISMAKKTFANFHHLGNISARDKTAEVLKNYIPSYKVAAFITSVIIRENILFVRRNLGRLKRKILPNL